MRLVCPACGAIASREAWENDTAARQFNALLVSLSPAVQRHATRYLGLFRKGERGLSWKRALKLLSELKDMVESGCVQWDGGEMRPAPPELWAEVMEYMVNSGKKELSDHHYLRKTVWSKARCLAAQTEQQRENARRHAVRDPEPVSDEERADVKDMFNQFFGRKT